MALFTLLILPIDVNPVKLLPSSIDVNKPIVVSTGTDNDGVLDGVTSGVGLGDTSGVLVGVFVGVGVGVTQLKLDTVITPFSSVSINLHEEIDVEEP